MCHSILHTSSYLGLIKLATSTSVNSIHLWSSHFLHDRHKRGDWVSLHLSSGSIVAFKSTLFNLTEGSAPQSCALSLFNKNGDTILSIAFQTGQEKIFYSGFSSKPYLDSWGKEWSTDLDVDRLQNQGARILVYRFLTDSRTNQYQILVNGTTMCYFDSHFWQPVTHISYLQLLATAPPILSNPLDIMWCTMLDLSPEEQRAISVRKVSRYFIMFFYSSLKLRASSLQNIPAPDSTAISIHPSHFIPNKTYTSIMWDDGKEVCFLWHWQLRFSSQITQIRNYYLGPRNILHEYAYLACKDKNSWYYGDLHRLDIVLDPTSSITAIPHQDNGIFIFFQGQCHNPSDYSTKWLLHG